MFKYDHDTGRIYDPEDDETIGYLDAQPKSRGLRMAAADDLLAALEHAVRVCEASDDKTGLAFSILINARAAIAKAKGES